MSTATLSPSASRVKFRLAGGAQPLILLPVSVNGEGPFDFILDTGAGTSLLSTELARQLDVKIIGAKEGQSAGGKVSVSLAKVDSLAVGEIRFDDPKRVEHFGKAALTEIPMRLANPAKPLILVDVYANGRGPFQFAIDTGSSTSAITPELARQLGLTSTPIGTATTAGEHVAVTAATLASFQVGGARIENASARSSGRGSTALSATVSSATTRLLSIIPTRLSVYSQHDAAFQRAGGTLYFSCS